MSGLLASKGEAMTLAEAEWEPLTIVVSDSCLLSESST